jgi:hypothetical protein
LWWLSQADHSLTLPVVFPLTPAVCAKEVDAFFKCFNERAVFAARSQV